MRTLQETAHGSRRRLCSAQAPLPAAQHVRRLVHLPRLQSPRSAASRASSELRLSPAAVCSRARPSIQRRSVATAAATAQASQAAAEEEDGEEDEEEDEPLEELSTTRHLLTVDGFAPDLCAELRGVFDERFRDPRTTHPDQFRWHQWWCPDREGRPQYHLMRTQAQVYFSAEQHERLVDALLAFGESQLGCRAITPIWMSYYTEGMFQELHCDNPHGPFAFVLSLTNWDGREFTGGETQILQPQTLSYWLRPDPSKGLEHCDLVQWVPAHFGRLTVFDPRFPHGVRRVHGTHDPRKGRLVLHGWFTDPAPFATGGLTAEEVAPALNEALAGAIECIQQGYAGEEEEEEEGEARPGSHPCAGVLSLRLHVDAGTGAVKEVQFLADTLVPLPSIDVDAKAVRADIQHELQAWMMDARFPPAAEDTFITLPVVFE